MKRRLQEIRSKKGGVEGNLCRKKEKKCNMEDNRRQPRKIRERENEGNDDEESE